MAGSRLSLARVQDLEVLPAWLEVSRIDDPWTDVGSTVRGRAGAELVERAGLLGLACSVVGETNDDRAVLARDLGHARPLPLVGLRVANLASLWAGPLAADVLARLGADVVTVESTSRPDGGRGSPRTSSAACMTVAYQSAFRSALPQDTSSWGRF